VQEVIMMFVGEEQVSIVTDMTVDEFYDKVRQILEERLGAVEISRRGELYIRPSGSLVSFLSDVKFHGSVTKTKDGYRVWIKYTLSPSTACWVLGVLLSLLLLLLAVCCVPIILVAIIFVPALEKSKVANAVNNALRILREETERR
jgi:uncharacterized membrane protein